MTHVIAGVNVKPESADAASDILVALAAASRKESDCERYLVFHRPDAPQVLQTIEEGDDQASADAHMQTPDFGVAVQVVGPMFTAPPEILAFVMAS